MEGTAVAFPIPEQGTLQGARPGMVGVPFAGTPQA